MSEKQLAANRLNAQKSTGPRSPEGKARVSKNARKHGLTGRDIVLPNESPEDYDSFRDGLLGDLAPCGDLEEVLADQIVSYAWRRRRVPMIEAGVFRRTYQQTRVKKAADEVGEFETSKDDWLRSVIEDKQVTDQAAHAVAERRLNEETAKLQEMTSNLIELPEKSTTVLTAIWRYDIMLSRSMERTLHELQRLQTARAGQVVPVPAAVDVNIDFATSGDNAREPN
jgi:hypothetical protein